MSIEIGRVLRTPSTDLAQRFLIGANGRVSIVQCLMGEIDDVEVTRVLLDLLVRCVSDGQMNAVESRDRIL